MKSKYWSIGCMVGALLASAMIVVAAAGDTQGGKAIDDYNFAVWLYNGGKYGLAAESYTAFLQNYADHERAADARFGLAQSLFHTDKFEQAAKEYAKVRTDYPAFPQGAELLFQLAQTYMALSRFAEAAPLFAEVTAKHPDHYLADWAVARQAACLISMDKNKDAEVLLKDFVGKYGEDNGRDTRAMLQKIEKAGLKAGDAFLGLVERSMFYFALAQFNQGHFEDAGKSFERFLSRYSKSDLQEEARFRLAQARYRTEAYPRAAEAYEQVASGAGKFAESAGFERGLALYKAGDLKSAATAFRTMADRFPQSPQAPKARLYAGTFLFEAGDFKGAIERLEPLARAKKEAADEASYWVAMCLLKSGRIGEAEQAFVDSARDFPKSSMIGDVRLGLADARLAQNKFEAAAAAFQEFARDFQNAEQAPRALYSACAALHRADKYAQSDDVCETFLGRYKTNDLGAQVLFLSAENRFLLKNYAKAADRYREFLKAGDSAADRVARAHYRLAWVHRYAKRNQEALDELRAIDLKAAGTAIAAEMKYLEGACLFDLGKHAEAVKALNEYLNARDHERFGDDALLKMAVAEMKQDRKSQAATHLECFIKEYPKSDLLPQVSYQLAECYYDQKAYAKAIDAYRPVADREQGDDLIPYAIFGIGLCYYDQGQWDDAIKAFDRLLAKYPKTDLAPQALYRKVRSLTKQKNWAGTEQAARALIAAYPKHELVRSTLVTLGSCLQEQQKWADAAAVFGTVANEYPEGDDQARIVYEQGWSWRQAGKEGESLQAFQRLAEKHSSDPLAADANFHLAEARYKGKPEAAASETVPQRNERLTAALALYGKVIEGSKDKRLVDKTLYRMGWCQWLMEQYQPAAETFDRLVKEFSNSELFADALFQAGQAYAKAGKADIAIERFRRLIDDKRSAAFEFLPDAHLGLANCLLILDKHEDAVAPLENVIGKSKDERILVQAYFLLGKARFSLKANDEALVNFQEVTRRTKTATGAEAQFYIGQVLHTKNDYKGAIVAYLRVIALYREHREWVAAAMFESAKCYEALNDKDQARTTYTDIVNNFKDTKWAKPAAERL